MIQPSQPSSTPAYYADATTAVPTDPYADDPIEALLADDVMGAGDGIYKPLQQGSGKWSEFVEPQHETEGAVWENRTAPPPVPAAQPVPGATGPLAGTTTKTSRSGIPGGKGADDLFAQIPGRVDGMMAGRAEEMEGFQSAYSDITDDRQNAVVEKMAREKEHFARVSALEDRTEDFYRTQADLEKNFALQAKAERDTYLAQVNEQLAGVRALIASSGNPLADLSATRKGALGFAAFAEGFLATRGIQINVTGQIDKWVDRELAEHQNKIKNSRQSAQDTLSLYEIARQGSKDDFEARQKYRGMVIEQLSAGIKASAARFGSETANSRAQEQLAQLDMERLKNATGLADKFHAERLDTYKALVTEAGKQGELRLQKEALEETKRYHNMQIGEQRAARRAAAEKVKEPKPELRIADAGATVRDPKTGKITGYIETHRVKQGLGEGITGKAYEKAANITQQYTTAIGALDDLRDLRAPAFDSKSSLIPISIWKKTSPEYRAYERAKINYQERLIKALTGAAAPEQQMKRIQSLLADDSLFQPGGNQSALIQLERELRGQMTGLLDSDPALERIPDAEQTVRPLGNTSNDTDAAYNAEFHGIKASNAPVDKAVASVVENKKRNEVREGGGFSPSYMRYAETTGDARGTGATSNREATRGQRIEMDGVDQLAALVVRPDLGVQKETVDGKEVQIGDEDSTSRAAYAALTAIASGDKVAGGKVADEETRAYANSIKGASYEEFIASRKYEDFAVRVHPVPDEPSDRRAWEPEPARPVRSIDPPQQSTGSDLDSLQLGGI